MSEPTAPASHLISMLQEFELATLVTRQRSGGLHGRPMSVAATDDDGTIWFITSVGSPKVEEISEDGRALVVMQNAKQSACLNGKVELVFDRDKIKQLWKEVFRVWFEGKSDPDIVLLRFTPFNAEYWDSSGLKGLRYVFEAARAYLSGASLLEREEQRTDPERHAKVNLWDSAGPRSS